MKKIEIIDGVTSGENFAKDINDNFNDLATGSTVGGITDVTYTELITLISTSGLTAGSQYRISDFNTRHYIVDGNGNRHFGEGNEVTGELEPLIVLATDVNIIDKEAKSSLYPQDIIYYDWNPDNWLHDMSFANADETYDTIILGFTGVITFRHDTLLDNYMGYDFRNVKFRRWETNTPTWNSGTTYVTDNFVNYNGFIYKSISTTGNTNNEPSSNSDYWVELLDLSLTTYWNNRSDQNMDIPSSIVYADFKTFAEGTGTATYDICCRSNHLEGFKDTADMWEATGSLLSNNVFFLQDENYYTVYSNSISAEFYGNTIGGIFYNNNIGIYFNYNTIGSEFNNNTIGIYFYYNIIGFQFYSNTIENDCDYNNIGNNFNSNSIGNDFRGNSIGNDFNNNTIGNEFYSNGIGNEFYSNTIGNDFNNNGIGNEFYSNGIGNYFFSNGIGNEFNNNTIANNFNNNSIGNDFFSNTIFNSIIYLLVTGNSFQYNTIKDGIDFIGINFTPDTHVYTNYSKKIFKRAGGAIRLSYYDENDVLNIVDPDFGGVVIPQ